MVKEINIADENNADILSALLQLSKDYSFCQILNNNNYPSNLQGEKASFEILAGFGISKQFNFQQEQDFSAMDKFINSYADDYLFCSINYNLKNAIHPSLKTKSLDKFNFSLLQITKAEELIIVKDETIGFSSLAIADAFESYFKTEPKSNFQSDIQLKAGILKDDYLSKIKQVKKHIQRGDSYELTFCQNFTGQSSSLDPELVYLQLNKINPSPFSCFLKSKGNYLLSASPERFLKKSGDKLYSQPIKGTLKRQDPSLDEQLKNQLLNSEKDRSENVMIVDLVRNDLSIIAAKGTVKVEELFGLYTFPKVFQLISTISCQIEAKTSFSEILKATFPMGSMTGAPKYRTMELIEELEEFNRSLFSGSVGYLYKGNFDLNVVIRSILYNEISGTISCPVGGAITIESEAEREYHECLWKLAASLEALSAKLHD